MLVCFLAGLTSVFAQDDFLSIVNACEGVTVSFTNDEALPWEIENGYVKSPAFSTKKSTYFEYEITTEKDLTITVDYAVYTYSSNDKFYIYRDESLWLSTYNADSEKRANTTMFLQAGTHKLKFEFYNYYSRSNTYAKIYSMDIKTIESQAINVTLSAPGTLGTEVLSQASSLPAVKYMKLSGKLNSDDWTKLNQMTGLQSLDMEDADVTEIPASAFSSVPLRFYKFPKTLKRIGDKAFYNKSMFIDLRLPEGLEEIGQYAFYGTVLTSCKLPSTVTTLGSYAFQNCSYILSFAFNSNIKSIPGYFLYGASSLKEVTGIENVTSVGSYSFYNCTNLSSFEGAKLQSISTYAFENTSLETIDLSEVTTIGDDAFGSTKLQSVNLPKITSLGTYAFYNCKSLANVTLSDKLSDIGNHAFNGCTSLTTVVLGASVSNFGSSVFRNAPIEKLYCNAPTPPKVNSSNPPFSSPTTIILYVPEYAKVSYKLDSYWSKFLTVEDNPNPVTDVAISNALELASGARIPSTANITMNWSGRLTVNGDAAQEMQKFTSCYQDGATSSSLISRCPNMSSTSSEARYYMNSGYWYFVCMPFDVKVSDITNTVGAAFVIRYYDGASRAANESTSGNWKDVAPDATLQAGKGYIFRVDTNYGYMVLPATDATHNRIFTSTAIETPLAAYPSETPANANWNLVGNPYPAFYDIYRMNYTAPITVWNVSNSTYTAYSIADDDLALLPYQAFFVQKPDAVSSITFDPMGRQHTTTISHDASAKARSAQSSQRRLINLTLSNGVTEDATRIVVNPMIDDAYCMDCDASKMLTYETTPQLYTMSDDVVYAINEGKHASGEVKIGMWFPESGAYTLDASKAECGYELYDNGTLVSLPYTFDASAGTDDSRFVMILKAGNATAIDKVAADKSAEMYDLTGRRIDSAAKKGIYIINNKKVIK